jgi:hypothetical protein
MVDTGSSRMDGSRTVDGMVISEEDMVADMVAVTVEGRTAHMPGVL